MAYESTSVPVSRSQEEIRRIVMRNGGTGVMFWSKPPREGFEAFVPFDGISYHVRIQVVVDAQKDLERAERRVWRVLYYHLKAIYEASSTGVLEFREMMMPYIVTIDGKTVSEHVLPQLQAGGKGGRSLLALPEPDYKK